MPSNSKPSVFVSYSHADVEWLTRLRVHLKPLERDATISVWTDANLKAGQNWKNEIAAVLKSAKVAVLLISADFLASDFIANEELPALLSAARREGTAILPMIIKPLAIRTDDRPRAIPGGKSGFGTGDQYAPWRPRAGIRKILRTESPKFFEKVRPARQRKSSPKTRSYRRPDEVFHPGNLGATRGALEACKFFVSPFYDKTKLWKYYGDIQVEILHDASGEKVFLIPSGAAPPHLRDTAYLRTSAGEAMVEQKRRAAEQFSREMEKSRPFLDFQVHDNNKNRRDSHQSLLRGV